MYDVNHVARMEMDGSEMEMEVEGKFDGKDGPAPMSHMILWYSDDILT